jgi:membrane-associated protease RseP (regulator of RpoE activity)
VADTLSWLYLHLPYGLRVLIPVLAAAWLALLVHELGHALMARLLGVRTWSIALGRGPKLWEGTVGHTRVRVALFPIHGEVRLYDGDAEAIGYEEAASGGTRFEWRRGQSWRAPLITVAGTVGNLLVARVVIAWWASGPRPHPPVLMWMTAFFLVNAFMLLNLIPVRGFDGWRIATQAAAWRRSATSRGRKQTARPWPFASSLRFAAIALQLALVSVFFDGAASAAIMLAALAAEVLSASDYAWACRHISSYSPSN